MKRHIHHSLHHMRIQQSAVGPGNGKLAAKEMKEMKASKQEVNVVAGLYTISAEVTHIMVTCPHSQITLTPPAENASMTRTRLTNTSDVPVSVRSYRYVATLPPKTGVSCTAESTSHWNFQDPENGVVIRRR